MTAHPSPTAARFDHPANGTAKIERTSIEPSPIEVPSDLATLLIRPESGWRRLMPVLMASWVFTLLTGCSLVLMANRMFFGDPLISSEFTKFTQIDLEDGEEEVLIVASTPHAVRSQVGSMDIDIVDGITRRLRVRNVKLADQNAVATWMDDRGGDVHEEDFSALGHEFDTDYIVHVQVTNLTLDEDNSPNFLQGRAEGELKVFEMREVGGEKIAAELFAKSFDVIYPRNYPRNSEQISENAFAKMYVSRLCDDLARMLHAYRPSELVE